MKYNAPPGAGADAPFLDGNRSAGVKGSVVPAAAIEADQRELVHLITFSGQTPSATDLQQVRKAIAAMISAATGSGDTSQFLLMAQARARLPIYPEILSADGKINVSSPGAGTILVPPTVNFQHRGIYPISTSLYSEAARTFTTAANKTYHVRWDPTNGFRMRDLADAAYNPTVLAETNAIFDSGYDDMLVARVVTSGGNIATITNLVNKARICRQIQKVGAITSNPAANLASGTITEIFNLARTPILLIDPVNYQTSGAAGLGNFTGSEPHDHDFAISLAVSTRYSVTATFNRDYAYNDFTLRLTLMSPE